MKLIERKPGRPRTPSVTKICLRCGKKYILRYDVKRQKYCSRKCGSIAGAKRGIDSIAWKGVLGIHNGYMYSGSNKHRQYIHRKTWEDAYGPIPEGFIVHHEDGNRKNNDLKNLQLMTRSEHMEWHRKHSNKKEA